MANRVPYSEALLKQVCVFFHHGIVLYDASRSASGYSVILQKLRSSFFFFLAVNTVSQKLHWLTAKPGWHFCIEYG